MQLAAIVFVSTPNLIPHFGQIFTNAHLHAFEVQNIPEYTFTGKTVDSLVLDKDTKGNSFTDSDYKGYKISV